MQQQTEDIPLAKIRLDGGTQPRLKIDNDSVAEHKAGYELAEFRPPLDVFFDGADYWLADGFHRWHGATQAKLEDHPCVVHLGTQRDAILFSVGANGKHGLRRTNDDKRKAVETLLRDKEWGQRSQNWIAEMCGVSSGFVSDIVAQLPLNGSSTRPEKTKGKDGKLRSARKTNKKTGNIESTEVVDNKSVDETKKISGGTKFDPAEWDDGPDRDESKPLVSVVKDSLKRPIPEPLTLHHQTASEIAAAGTKLDQVKKLVEELSGKPGGEFIEQSRIEEELKSVKARITTSRYWTACPRCSGAIGSQCDRCDGHGFLPHSRKNQLTSEDKAKLGIDK